MTDDKLIAHARRLHALACGQGASRHDLIQLRDLVPRLLERIVALGDEEADTALRNPEPFPQALGDSPITLSVVS